MADEYFRSVLNKSADAAKRLLDPAPKWIDKDAQQSLLREIAENERGTAIAKWRGAFVQDITDKQFHHAFLQLGDPPPGLGDAEVADCRNQVRTAWLNRAIGLRESAAPKEVRDCVATLLADFSDCREARLLERWGVGRSRRLLLGSGRTQGHSQGRAREAPAALGRAEADRRGEGPTGLRSRRGVAEAAGQRLKHSQPVRTVGPERRGDRRDQRVKALAAYRAEGATG